MNRTLPTTLGMVAAAAIGLGTARGADWPGFRGETGGVTSDTALPRQWTKDEILWKAKLPGPGASSPITHGNKVFVTCYTGYGTALTRGFKKGAFGKGPPGGGDQDKLRLVLLCLDAGKGDILWQKDIAPKLPEHDFTGFLREHGYASSTPVTDGEHIYTFFGKTGVIAWDMEGKQLWQQSVGTGTDKWGSASSPVLTKDLAIVNASVESESLVALDKTSGKEAWRVKDVPTGWTSPLLVDLEGGKQELVFAAPGKVTAYDPATGKELWHCKGIGKPGVGYVSSTPVAHGGIVYVVGGGAPNVKAAAFAVRAGGSGDVSESHVLWRQNAGTGISSPVLAGGDLFWAAGMANCLDAKTGKIAYQERLYDARGEYVSPVADRDQVLVLTRFDGLYVVAAGSKFEQRAHLTFADDDSIFNASPAVSNGRVFLRSNAYLYCLGKK